MRKGEERSLTQKEDAFPQGSWGRGAFGVLWSERYGGRGVWKAGRPSVHTAVRSDKQDSSASPGCACKGQTRDSGSKTRRDGDSGVAVREGGGAGKVTPGGVGLSLIRGGDPGM